MLSRCCLSCFFSFACFLSNSRAVRAEVKRTWSSSSSSCFFSKSVLYSWISRWATTRQQVRTDLFFLMIQKSMCYMFLFYLFVFYLTFMGLDDLLWALRRGSPLAAGEKTGHTHHVQCGMDIYTAQLSLQLVWFVCSFLLLLLTTPLFSLLPKQTQRGGERQKISAEKSLTVLHHIKKINWKHWWIRCYAVKMSVFQPSSNTWAATTVTYLGLVKLFRGDGFCFFPLCLKALKLQSFVVHLDPALVIVLLWKPVEKVRLCFMCMNWVCVSLEEVKVKPTLQLLSMQLCGLFTLLLDEPLSELLPLPLHSALTVLVLSH